MRRSGLSALLVGVALVVGCAPAASPGPSGGAPSPAPTVPGPTGAPALALVVDSDMAPDDVTAIASLLRDPAVDLRAITVVGTGEAHCPGGMFVARSIITMLLERAVPVTCGNGSPLGPAEEFPAEWRAGADAGGGLTLVSPGYVPDPRPAPELLAELAAAEAGAGGRLTILTLGTMTNVASALDVDPDLPSEVRLVSMLGAVGVPGNVTTQPGDPTAEWNAHADPTAVRRVLEAGFDWTLVPLDATNDVPLTPELLVELESDHAAGPADLVFELWARNPFLTQGGSYLWDPLASVATREASVVTTREARLTVVEGAGLDGGRLVEDPAGHPVTVATSADRRRFEAFLLERLRLGPARANAFTVVGTVSVTGGDGTCDATLDPATPPAGLLRVRFTNTTTGPMGGVVFELAGYTWSEIEAFVADFETTTEGPPVVMVAQLGLEGSGSTTGYGVSPAGTLGVACFQGPFDAPTIRLAGPFPIGP